MIVNYNNKDFNSLREELITYSRNTYGISMSPASIDLMLADLNAGIGDMLSYNTEKKFIETQLESAQEYDSLLAFARTYGLKIPHKRASMTVCDFSINVPVLGDTYDPLYTPILKMGTQVSGGGQVFELSDDIDFNSDLSSNGVPNRIILPNINNNQDIVSYTIIKQEIVISGTTKIGRKLITKKDYKPFMEIVITEDNVINIDQVIQMDSLPMNEIPSDSDFLDFNKRFFEVPSLIENKIFTDEHSGNIPTDSSFKSGVYFDITKKFITEYTNSGYIKLIFGGGKPNNTFISSVTGINVGNSEILNNYLNNDSLGEIPTEGKTIYYKYRVGGGSGSNIGQGVLNNIGNHILFFEGDNDSIKNEVTKSIKVNNPIPAIGGMDKPDIETIRKYISYNFSSQNRCVTTRDYMAKIFEIPGRYGSPFRVNVKEKNNKIVISILSLGNDGKLKNSSNNILKQNIANYLSKYRMINDYIEIEDGKIINLSVDCDLLIDKSYSRSEVQKNVINKINSYFDISKQDMNQNIYMSSLIEEINNVGGVRNIIDIRIYNKVASIESPNYSTNETSMSYKNETTREIELVDGILFGENNGMFEIKYPNKDIRIRNKVI